LKKPSDFEVQQEIFIANQNQYRSTVAKYIKERNMAYVVAIVMFFLALGCLISTVIMAHEAKVQALIFDKDGQFIGVPNTKTKINDKALVISQLADYITYLYSVPNDMTAKEHNVIKVVAMTDSNYFNSQILPIIKQNLLKYQNTQVIVKVNSIVPTSDGEWIIDFSSFVSDHKIGSYKTILHYRQDLNLDSPSKMINNPLGIYITSLDTQEKLSD
jgi:type IV secretory pathway TrbF-like protein